MKQNSLVLVFTLLLFTSCKTIVSSPSIAFRNASSENALVKNIKVNWNGYHLISESFPIDICVSGGGQSFNLAKRSDLFGSVKVWWENSKGEKNVKSFIFKESDLPNFNSGRKYGPFEYPSVVLYFNQTDVEYYTSDTSNLRKVQKEKQGNWVLKYDEAKNKHFCINDPKERKRLEEVSKKYPVISKKTGRPIDDE